MPSAFENLHINRLIVHEVYKREQSGAVAPRMNDVVTTLDAQGLGELQNRVVNALGHDSHAIEMDIVRIGDGSVFSFISPYFVGNQTERLFVEISRNLTICLHNAQVSRTIPGGVVVVFEGTTGVGNQKYIGVIKAEKHGGFTLEGDRGLRFVRDLLLTPQQKLYKISMLVCSNATDNPLTPDNITVSIFDSNNDKALSKSAAEYFYDGFMGCAFQKKSNVLTRDFYNSTKEFITKKSGFTGETIVAQITALHTYLKVDNRPNINAREYCQQYIPTDIQDRYLAHIEQSKIPLTNIHKDIDLIMSSLRLRKLKFTNNVTLSAPVDDFSNNVTILETTATTTTMRINGKITSET